MQARTAGETGQATGRWWALTLTGTVLVGAVLRLIWVNDIEYKDDERWTFERTQQVGRTEPLPWLGMPTSYEVRHPGGTVWVFLALGRLFDVHEPTELARACQLLNVAALVVLVLFTFLAVPRAEREPWLWAAALAAVNPLAVLLQRKIWPPSVLPTFLMLLLLAWWYRDRRWGAFAWGVLGALLGCLYPAALFFAAGFTAWALLYDRRGVRWRWWLGGSCLGALPLLPWLHYAWTATSANPISQRRWTHVLEFKFWLRWLTEPFGISLEYALGDDLGDFLSYPLVGGRPTYLVGLLHVAVAAAAVVLLFRVACRLWRERGRWRVLWAGRGSPTAFTQNAALWGFGIVFTLSLLPIHRHYMVLGFPLMFLWLARAVLSGQWPVVSEDGKPSSSLTTGHWPLRTARAFLVGLWAAELLITVSFLGYVHVNQRPIRGDYGLPYGAARAGRTASEGN